jgi:fumarate reductase subunit C
MKNPKVVVYSLIALFFLFLTFTVDWIFIIPAVILMIINQKELFKKNKK